VSGRVVRALRRKSAAFSALSSFPSPAAWRRFLRARRSARGLVRSARRRFERRLAARFSASPRAFWGFVRSRFSPPAPAPSLRGPDGSVASSPSSRAAVLSRFFSSVFSSSSVPFVPPPPSVLGLSLSSFSAPSLSAVAAALRCLPCGGAPGPDGLVPVALRSCAAAVAVPLSLLFSRSLSLGRLPSAWRSASVVALPKGGDPSLPSSYRPVSLTSVVCRVLERFVRAELSAFLARAGVLSDSQHGFRSARSVLTCLASAVSGWVSSLSAGRPVDVLFLDFKKAFDRVQHSNLLARLSACGVAGSALDWLSSFLLGREMWVSVEGVKSPSVPVLSGVPQGSVLGPLLFLLSVWDLPSVVRPPVHVLMYADDLCLWAETGSGGRLALQEALNGVSAWSDSNGFSFSAEKCVALSLSSAPVPPPSYFLGTDAAPLAVRVVSEERDLGVLVDERLTFRPHVHAAVARARRSLGVLVRCFRHLDRRAFLVLYKALVRPHLEFCSPVWNSVGSGLSSILEGVQRRATRAVPGLATRSYPERLRALGLPTLRYRRARSDMLLVYRVLSSPAHPLSSILPPRPSCGTRGHSRMLARAFHRKKLARNFFSSRVVPLWNSLPDTCVTASTVNMFKSCLNSHFRSLPLKFDPSCSIWSHTAEGRSRVAGGAPSTSSRRGDPGQGPPESGQ